MMSLTFTALMVSMTGKFNSLYENFIICKSSSLVSYPVGLYNVFFHQDKSVENKILFEVLKGVTGTGRWGSLVDNEFAFALLNWGWGAQKDCAYYVLNAAAMGIQVHRTHCQQHMTDFFNHKILIVFGSTITLAIWRRNSRRKGIDRWLYQNLVQGLLLLLQGRLNLMMN